MTDTTAKIRAKGLDGTGFTEDLAARLFNRVGANLKAIVELQVVDKHGPNLDGKRGIELVITQLEVADDANLEEHLRELTQTLYYNRGLEGHTGTTTEGQERTVADVMASGQQYRPHPFLPDDAAKDTPICDVCGGIEASAVHSTQDVLDEPDDDASDVGDTDEPHVFEATGSGDTAYDLSCVHCGRHENEDANVHVDLPPAGELSDEDRAELDAAGQEPWEYEQPEGTATTIPDPFTAPATT